MNVFDALTQGNGAFREENFTSFLTYLLDSEQSHGLNYKFFYIFLEEVFSHMPATFNQEVKNIDLFEIIPEVTYGSRTIDIVIKGYIRNGNSLEEKLRIGIENKINEGAADETQLKEEYENLKIDLEQSSSIDSRDLIIAMVFLVPINLSGKLKEEYNNLVIDQSAFPKHIKTLISWVKNKEVNYTKGIREALIKNAKILVDFKENTESATETKPATRTEPLINIDKSIVSMLKEMITQEYNSGPIHEYTKHTIKAFIEYIERRMLLHNYGHPPFLNDPSTEIAEVTVHSNDKFVLYRLKRKVTIYKHVEEGKDSCYKRSQLVLLEDKERRAAMEIIAEKIGVIDFNSYEPRNQVANYIFDNIPNNIKGTTAQRIEREINKPNS